MQVDLINAVFEFAGTGFVGVSIWRVAREKAVAGVSWISPGFFFVWGLWNLLYYPSLGQWWSFVAGICLSSANAIWIVQLLYYSSRSGITHDQTGHI